MTRENAIKIFNTVLCLGKCDCPKDEIEECLKMAIKALEAQPSEDCISRKAVLEAFSDYVGGGMSMNDFDAMWDIVVKMPPVEPKPKPCEDCISRQAAIEALWKALHEYEDKTENQFLESKELDVADWIQYRIFVQNMSDIDRQTILNLPSVTPQPKEEPQQKTGHWVLSGGYWRCSECKEKTLLKLDKATGGYREYEPVRSKYCPKCGIKMQEVKK